MLKLNKEEYLDKLHSCWLGKNIGGTIGAPYEGNRNFLDVRGFESAAGDPLPNDDLDLQLAWLRAMEDVGAKHLSTNILAQYWLDYISPSWNEYGICKTNLNVGLLPPMSGEIDNKKWKTSNGAWIRSEIWAAMAPGAPDIAVKYAVMDAMVDHGVSEGVCAEIFTASIQSLAFIESDILKLLNTALLKIDENSMVAKTVRLVMECYQNGIDYKTTRERVVELTKELGWFQAPANVGFVAIGLLYGEGDFKKSLLYATNCGDDTDCTAATVGATLGIIGGSAAIPEDWASYIGDKIVCISINGSYYYRLPKTCKELTDRIFALVPDVMKANDVAFCFADVTDYPEGEREKLNKLTADDFLARSPYSYDITEHHALSVRVEHDKAPKIKAGDERQVTLTFRINPKLQLSRRLLIKLILPETWSVSEYEKNILLEYRQLAHSIPGATKTSFTLTVGEQVEAINRVYVEVTSPQIPYPIMVPITFIG